MKNKHQTRLYFVPDSTVLCLHCCFLYCLYCMLILSTLRLTKFLSQNFTTTNTNTKTTGKFGNSVTN